MAEKVSVIVPTWNRRDNVINTLKCLWAQEIQPQHTMEILIMDHGSTDGTMEALTYLRNPSRFHTRIIPVKKRDFWTATVPKNYGARQSDPASSCLIFVDSDVMLPPDRIQRYIDLYLRGDMDQQRVIIGAYHHLKHPIKWEPNWWKKEMVDYDADVRWKMITEEFTDPMQKHQGKRFALACYGGNILIPRRLFFKVGGFDENLMEGEDGDLGLTLWETGASVSMDAGLLGWHQPHEIVRERQTTNWTQDHGIPYIDKKHRIDTTKETIENMRRWGIDFKPPEDFIKAGGYSENEFTENEE